MAVLKKVNAIKTSQSLGQLLEEVDSEKSP
jgi:hypothetical protein